MPALIAAPSVFLFSHGKAMFLTLYVLKNRIKTELKLTLYFKNRRAKSIDLLKDKK